MSCSHLQEKCCGEEGSHNPDGWKPNPTNLPTHRNYGADLSSLVPHFSQSMVRATVGNIEVPNSSRDLSLFVCKTAIM